MSLRRALRAAAGVVLIVVLLVLLWPARFGGATALVVVQGNSMEPTYHQGDLLYARTGGDFSPGDIVVYRVPDGQPGAGRNIVHRIKLVLPDGRYLFQGDNRATPDDVTPTRDDLVGTPVVNLGNLPTRAIILAPFVLGLIAAIAITVLLWPSRPGGGELDDDGDEDEPKSSGVGGAAASGTAAASWSGSRYREPAAEVWGEVRGLGRHRPPADTHSDPLERVKR